ncbi:hypothetical protein C4587_01775 [Candidatus Parcubacteria bacterium]|nr:MAG: hypothetical protein C4587_01775 [Candidatus Parcubacteria bacterium]
MLAAYDFESTAIAEGTPELLYVTGFGDSSFRVSTRLDRGNRLERLRDILINYFLLPEYSGAKFVAWNGNRFDVYFIIQALLHSPDYVMQPYMTASKALRGLRVKSTRKYTVAGKRKILQYEFLDGISMTGMVGKTLESFLKTFAPELPKLKLDLENIEFNPDDAEHVKYAERDSEGLYIGMKRVQEIILRLTGENLKPTIGNLAIKYFMSNVPQHKRLKNPTDALYKILHGPVKRGGYCWCMKQYTGPVWKYDINQAYAAAMRDAQLPAGDSAHTDIYIKESPGVYLATISRKPFSLIPFYYKLEKVNEGRFTTGAKPVTCWITSIEIEHLRADGWDVSIDHGYYWTDSFNFSKIVSDLETLRATDPDGPSGPLGTMVKAIGNNAYGKTLEQLSGLELIIASDAPDGWDLYDPFDEACTNVFSRTRAVFQKPHHLPQIGVFVTALVRCKVRTAALLSPETFLYADTDSTVFSKPAPLTIHKTHYGDWKIEAEGVNYIILGKKIFYGEDGTTKAKGLMTRKLQKVDYEKWMLGDLPVQEQVQRNNLLKFLTGHDMFRLQERKGTDTGKSKVYRLKNGEYLPS